MGNNFRHKAAVTFRCQQNALVYKQSLRWNELDTHEQRRAGDTDFGFGVALSLTIPKSKL